MAALPLSASDAGCETHPMLIQCQSCATRFRIDPARIPRRKTFVRCKACGTPIYLDPSLEGEEATEWADAGLIPATEFEEPALDASTFGTPAAQLASHAAGAGRLPADAMGMSASGMGEPGAGAGHRPDDGESGSADGLLVQCPNCQSRYRVPSAPLQRPRIKLKCSVCGHLFAPPPAAAAGGPGETLDTFFAAHGAPAAPAPQEAAQSTAGTGLDESAVERLHGAPAPFAAAEPVPDPEQAYLDAVALDLNDEGLPPAKKVPDEQKYRLFLQPDAFKPPGGGEAAPPSGAPPAPAAAEAQDEEPVFGAAPAETPATSAPAPGGMPAPAEGGAAAPEEEFVLPPLEGDLTLAALEPIAPEGSVTDTSAASVPGAAARAPGGAEDDLPPLDEDTDEPPSLEELAQQDPGLPEPEAEGATGAASVAPDFDLDALPRDAFEEPKPMDYEPPPPPPLGGRAVVPFEAGGGREGSRPREETIERELAPGQVGWLTDRHRFLVLTILAGVMVGAIVGWGGWLAERQDAASRPFAFESGRAHRLVLDEALDGRPVVQRSGKHLFVVEGQLVNRFPKSVKVSWVRLRGKLYGDTNENQLFGTAQAYLGNVLTLEQLETLGPTAIAAYGAYNNGRNNVNFEIPPGRKVAFQLVFMDVQDPVQRTVADVISYVRDGVTVYVDAPDGG